MTKQHPITPPPELVEQWLSEHYGTPTEERKRLIGGLATEAARWGADQELRACCDTLQRHAHWDLAVFELMDDRRPKPPSLKEQALKALAAIEGDFNTVGDRADTIRRALEALDD